MARAHSGSFQDVQAEPGEQRVRAAPRREGWGPGALGQQMAQGRAAGRGPLCEAQSCLSVKGEMCWFVFEIPSGCVGFGGGRGVGWAAKGCKLSGKLYESCRNLCLLSHRAESSGRNP